NSLDQALAGAIRRWQEPAFELTPPIPWAVSPPWGSRSPHEATCQSIASGFRQGRSMPGFHRTTPTECRAILRRVAVVACSMADVARSLSEENIAALGHYLSRQEAGQ